jgi:GNAT superfamily N-acetyltransferase
MNEATGSLFANPVALFYPGGGSIMATIREVSAHDLAAVARLDSARDPVAEPITVAELAEEWRTFPQDGVLRLMLAEAEDGAVGFSRVSRLPWWGEGRFTLDVATDPTRRGQGIGASLFREAESFALARGATRLDAGIREGDASSREFAEKRGFCMERHLFSSTLELASFDPAPFAPALERVAASGIRILSLAEVPDDEETRQRFYAVNRTCALDIPGREPTFSSYEAYVERVFAAPSFRREAQFIALDGDRWAGFARLEPLGEEALWHGMTGVVPAYRGRSIALALKVKAIAYARQAGYRRLRTNNDAENAPMLAINQKLGYRPEPGVYLLRKG